MGWTLEDLWALDADDYRELVAWLNAQQAPRESVEEV